MFGTCNGAFAEYVTARPGKVAPKPANLTFEQSATVPTSGSTALQALRKVGKVTPVIDSTYSLSEVPEAIHHLEEGHARGKVVITA